MKVSIVIATYNRKELLSRGLYTLLRTQKLPEKSEILIIDDGSTDGTQDMIEPMWGIDPEIKYIYLNHPEPRISCHARNVGIKQAIGDIIIFTEPEALQVGNTIAQLLEDMTIHPDNTTIASQVWTMGERIQEDLSKAEERYFQHPAEILTHPYAMLTSGNLQNTKAPDSDWAISGERYCNAGVLFATKKEWLMKIGGFDESFTGHGFDDFDLFNRLAIIGHGALKDPDIAVIHMWHSKAFYPYNVYEHAEKNGKISEANIHAGIYEVNKGKKWGEIE